MPKRKPKEVGDTQITISGPNESVTMSGTEFEQISKSIINELPTITIKKAKIKNDVLEVEYTEEINGNSNTVKKECEALVHDDLKSAFVALDEHLVALCEQNAECTCTGFSIGGHDEHEGVTLIGRRELANNRILNLVSPFTKFNDEFAPYSGSSDMENAIALCKEEIQKYLFEGKIKSETKQIELPL